MGADGALTPVPGSPFSVGKTILSLAVDSHGGFVYATAETNPYFFNGVFAYSIGSNGSLTLITGSPFKTGHEPFGITVDQNGKFVYVCNSMSNNVWGYHIESTGGLRRISGDPFAVGSSASFIALDPTGSFAYVSASSGLKIESVAQNGALTLIGHTKVGRPNSLAVDPTGKFLYVADDATNSLAAYSIDSSGSLTPLPNSRFATGSSPFGVVVDRTGTFVYVTNYGDNSVSGYRIGSNGGLSQLSGSPFAAGTNPYRLTVAP